MLPGQMLPGHMSPWLFASVENGSRNPPLKFGQNRASNSWDMASFGPNSKGRFLRPFLTDANPHSDLCPGNICPGNICPYQEYLSCYWPNFDQTFWTQFFAGFKFFDPKFLWTQNFVDSKFLWTQKIFDLKLYQPKKILDQKLFFSPKSCLIKNYGSYIWTKKRFFDNMFLNQRFFWINIFWTKKCLDLTFFWNENFWTKFLETYIKLTYPPVMFLLNSNKNAMSKQKKMIVSDQSLITECSLHQGCFRAS